MVEPYGHAWPKPSPTVDPLKDPLHREFGTHDVARRELFSVCTTHGNRAQTRVLCVSELPLG
jgi:hypothetical protein